ncbi:uncharacterized protein LOC120355663, partial [Nilaparvata lugens]|uniref:uncharacterized protein LOC120355663 n=1 Tax=Nilaparvata lugens TaxID=108931 RepID=UPI00193E87D3
MEYDNKNSISAAELDDNIELEDEQPMKANPLTEIEDNIMIDECMNDVNGLQEYETQMFTELKEFDVTNTCFTTEIADNMEYDQQNSISTADNIELEENTETWEEYINVKGRTVNCRNVKPPCNELK